MSAAGPPQGANWPCRPRRCETQRLLVPSMPAQAGMEPRHSAPAFGGSAAAEWVNEAASVGVHPVSAAGPPQGANCAPAFGGSAAAELTNEAASMGVHQ